MKKIGLFTLIVVLGVVIVTLRAKATPTPPTSEEVMEVTQRVADWQIRTFHEQAKYRAPWGRVERTPKDNYHDLEWELGVLYSGMYEFAALVDQDNYYNWLMQIGDRNGWKLHRNFFHADDHVVGQMYLKMYEHFDESKMIEPTQSQFDEILAHEEVDRWHWDWCDALFMAPPVWAKLAQMSGDMGYLEYMDEQYRMTYDKLWSKDKKLFFRDERFITEYEKNGENIFWSRGNGWVYGGLALMIPYFPENWEGTQFYIDIFTDMSQTLKQTQRKDGTWSGGILGDVKDYPKIDTSGTAFFAYGLAWGINNGILDRETYEPVLLKSWKALVGAVHEDGMLGYVQGVGAAPGQSDYNKTEVYGIGAFLAAGSEMYKFVEKYY